MTASDVLLPQAATFGAGAGVGTLGASLGVSLAVALLSLAPSLEGASFFASPDDFSSLDLGPHDPVVALSVACNQNREVIT